MITAKTYKIIRFYSPQDGRPNKTIKKHLTLAEAQRHCQDPTTKKEGVFFDGYTEERITPNGKRK